MKLTQNFELEEFLKSSTAEKMGITLKPNSREIYNIRELCIRLLQPLRDYIGRALTITSGYRNQQLNKAVGGVSNSNHLCINCSAAADIQCKGLEWDEFIALIDKFIEEKQPVFDEIIIEKSGRSKWIHIAYSNAAGRHRMKRLKIVK